MPLTDVERSVLDLERTWWAGPGAPATKAQAIAALGISAPQFYALRRALADRPDALAYDPLVVRRLRRDLAARRRVRFEGPRTGEPRR